MNQDKQQLNETIAKFMGWEKDGIYWQRISGRNVIDTVYELPNYTATENWGKVVERLHAFIHEKNLAVFEKYGKEFVRQERRTKDYLIGIDLDVSLYPTSPKYVDYYEHGFSAHIVETDNSVGEHASGSGSGDTIGEAVCLAIVEYLQKRGGE